MVRKLEKIEKEMGYCEIKLERERRLRRQAEFLTAELEAVERFLKLYESSDVQIHEFPFGDIAHQIAVERSRSDRPGPAFERAREGFLSAGVFQMVREDREILVRERDELLAKLATFSGFSSKRSVLESERRVALEAMSSETSSRLVELTGEFDRAERLWNSLTEDALNIDEALFYLARNVDYVKSARAFLIAAKGSFDVENWVDSGYVDDIFRHSNIARTKEMLDGACRNQKLAQKELCCMVNQEASIAGFEPILVEFLDALFRDIFLDGRLGASLDRMDSALKRCEAFVAEVRGFQEQLHEKLDRAEKERTILFQRMGGERRGQVAAP